MLSDCGSHGENMQLDHIPSGQNMIWPDKEHPNLVRPPKRKGLDGQCLHLNIFRQNRLSTRKHIL